MGVEPEIVKAGDGESETVRLEEIYTAYNMPSLPFHRVHSNLCENVCR